MQEITLEEIQKKFGSLPENLRLAILVSDADKKINTIGRENGLNVNQNTELLFKTHLVMLGFIHPDKLEDFIKEITDIPLQVVKSVAKDIDEQILKDIRDDLIALAEKPKEESEPASPLDGSGAGWDKKSDEILKSAGIEIKPLVLNNEVKNKTRGTEIRGNEEIMKIAFENIKSEVPTPEGVRVPVLEEISAPPALPELKKIKEPEEISAPDIHK
ncbi:MAG: hypothetical protein AAB493_02755 [Patescibacteria group bacterium]